jgi:hypothetical protein
VKHKNFATLSRQTDVVFRTTKIPKPAAHHYPAGQRDKAASSARMVDILVDQKQQRASFCLNNNNLN